MIFLENSSVVLHWLENSEVALFIRQSTWLYPAVEIIHIIGFTVLVGAAFLFDLRLLGLARKIPVRESVKHFIFWARIGFLVVLPSGLILFMVDAVSIAYNPVFRIKLILIFFACLNAFIFHTFTVNTVDKWNFNKMPPVKARIAGILSILLWFSVIACGRLIAYT